MELRGDDFSQSNSLKNQTNDDHHQLLSNLKQQNENLIKEIINVQQDS